jgi:hypothetical protein
MRFRLLLPALQTIAMLLIVWAPWAARTHEIDLIQKDGREIKSWTLIPAVNAMNWALGLNLPAGAIVTPAEFAVRRTDAPPNSKVRFFGLWLVGLLCWHMVGRFVDDLFRWRHDRVLPPQRGADMAFALLAVPSAILLAGPSFSTGANVPVLAVWSALWIVVACAAMLFRFAQFFRESFKLPGS